VAFANCALNVVKPKHGAWQKKKNSFSFSWLSRCLLAHAPEALSLMNHRCIVLGGGDGQLSHAGVIDLDGCSRVFPVVGFGLALRGSLFSQGTNIVDGEEVAIKLESVQTEHPQLLYEAKLYKLLQGGGVPPVASSQAYPPPPPCKR
jgi:hypothetical protein